MTPSNVVYSISKGLRTAHLQGGTHSGGVEQVRLLFSSYSELFTIYTSARTACLPL